MTDDDNYITIRKKRIPTQTLDLPIDKLSFWSDNPRVYSLLDRSAAEPDQQAIYISMLGLEHVRTLQTDIAENGGLIDPIIVRDGDYVVIEGNSRLAAYRFLASKDPSSWSKIRAKVLPADISDADVYAMLGQYHLKGKKDWAPYEKAGFVYRRHINQKIDISVIAGELGVSAQSVRHLVDVYQFMLASNDDTRERWSHYDEFLKSRKIQEACEEVAGFKDVVVEQIKGGTIRAVDIRDQLPVVCKAPRVLKKFANQQVGLDDAFNDARHAGGDSVELSKIKRFRAWIGEASALDDILDHNPGVRQKMEYELGKLETRISSVRDQLNKLKVDEQSKI